MCVAGKDQTLQATAKAEKGFKVRRSLEGSIKKRGTNHYKLEVSTGRKNASGNYITKSEMFYGAKPEAEKRLADFVDEQRPRRNLGRHGLTVGEYLTEWIDGVLDIETSTIEANRRTIDNHIIPAPGRTPGSGFGQIVLADLNRADCKRLVVHWNSESGRHDGKGKLAPATIRRHHAVLHAALADALREKLIPENYAADPELPKATKSKAHSLTANQAAAMMKGATDHHKGYLKTPTLLMLGCGLRRAEVCALHWQDVTWGDKPLLTVRGSVMPTKSGLEIKEPKNGKARRVDIPAFVLRALLAHREKQDAVKTNLGELYQDHDLVCPAWSGFGPSSEGTRVRRYGELWDPRTLGREIRALAQSKHVGLPRGTGAHTLRHTFATLHLQAGTNPKIVSDWLGHHSVAFTLDTYAHVLPGIGASAAANLDAILNRRHKVGPDLGLANVVPITRKKKSPMVTGFPMVGARGLEPLASTVSM